MIIAIDIDDVCNNLINAVCEELNSKYGYTYTIEDFTEWDFKNILPTNVVQRIFDILGSNEFIEKLEMQEDADKYIDLLREQGHDIYFVTATYPYNLSKKFEWLEKHLHAKPREFVALHDKWRFNADFIIDDKLETIKTCVGVHRICFNKPWNIKSTEWDETMDIHRVSNWYDAYSVIQEIIEKEQEEMEEDE